MRTAVIDSKDAGQYSGGGGGGGGGGNGAAAAAQYPELASCSKFDPACFRMPIPNLRPGEMVEMAISYFEALDYVVRADRHFTPPHSFPNTKLISRCGTGRSVRSLGAARF